METTVRTITCKVRYIISVVEPPYNLFQSVLLGKSIAAFPNSMHFRIRCTNCPNYLSFLSRSELIVTSPTHRFAANVALATNKQHMPTNHCPPPHYSLRNLNCTFYSLQWSQLQLTELPLLWKHLLQRRAQHVPIVEWNALGPLGPLIQQLRLNLQ